MTLREVLRRHGLTEADLLDAQVGVGSMRQKVSVEVSFSVHPGGQELDIRAEAWVPPIKKGLVRATDSPFGEPVFDDALHIAAPWDARVSLCGQSDRASVAPFEGERPDGGFGCWTCLQAARRIDVLVAGGPVPEGDDPGVPGG